MSRKLENDVTDNNTSAGIIDRTIAVRVIAVVLLVCMTGTAVVLLGMRILFGTTLNEPTTIEVRIETPAQIVVNEPFAVTIEVTSLVTTSQTLHSLDLDRDYLKNVQLSGSSPAYQTVQALPLTRFNSFRFEEPLAGLNTTVIELNFVGQTAGQFSGLIDICLDDGTLCLARPLETAIIE